MPCKKSYLKNLDDGKHSPQVYVLNHRQLTPVSYISFVSITEPLALKASQNEFL